MKRSLSVVLPVCNAERNLRRDIQHIFDILSDLTERFEVLVVDEGSTDQTMEVAHELSVLYPQLRVARTSGFRSAAADHASRLQQAVGDVVLLQGAGTPFSPSEVRRIWKLCDSQGQTPLPRQFDTTGDSRSELRKRDAIPRPLAYLGRADCPVIASETAF